MTDKRIDQFTFSLSAGKHSKKDIELQIEALEHRLSYIANKVEIQDIPIVKHILGLTMDEKEIERLGKALIKIAPLASELQELQKKNQIIEYSLKKPEWMASTFADFSSEVEQIISMKEDG